MESVIGQMARSQFTQNVRHTLLHRGSGDSPRITRWIVSSGTLAE